MSKDNNVWYDINKTLSYNCLFNFVISDRVAGKTYGATKKCLLEWIRHKKQFIYLRRFESELKDKDIKSFFKPLQRNGEFKNYKLEVKEGCFLCNGEVCGYYQSLTTAMGKRGVSFPNVYYMIFDEFMIYDKNHHYIQNEVNEFMDYYNTIDRFEDRVKVFFFANAETTMNPYLLKFKLGLQKGQKICRIKNLALLERYTDSTRQEKHRKTKFGQLAALTGYDKMAINNEFARDNKDFISKKSKFAKYMFCYKYESKIYGVWVSYNEGKMWVSYDYDKYNPLCYALTTNDMEENTLVIKKLKQSNVFMTLINSFKESNVYFENLEIKTTFTKIIEKFL